MHYQIYDILNYCCITNINLSIKDKNNCRYKNLRMVLFENYLIKNVENKNDHKLALTHTHTMVEASGHNNHEDKTSKSVPHQQEQ